MEEDENKRLVGIEEGFNRGLRRTEKEEEVDMGDNFVALEGFNFEAFDVSL